MSPVDKVELLSILEAADERCHLTSAVGSPQKYVQDVLQEQLAQAAYKALKEQGGHIYVCGDVTMAGDVLKTIQRIMRQQGQLSVEEAGVFLSRLRVSNTILVGWLKGGEGRLVPRALHLALPLPQSIMMGTLQLQDLKTVSRHVSLTSCTDYTPSS